jgi:hypothetical protein
VILAALFLIVSEYFGIRLWSIALGLGQEPTVPTPTPLPTDEPFPTEEPFPTNEPFPTEDPLGVFGQLAGWFAQFLVGVAVAMIVLPPIIAVFWVLWTRLILETLVTHFKVEDNTKRTPLVDQTQPTS